MAVSVREHAWACQATCPSTEFRLNALPQASSTVSHVLTGQDTFVIVLLALALALVAAVVLTAVWSGDGERRKAALAVLDRLIRWRL
jgi:hypothetical protein